jgi:hypothetical protein
MMASANPTYLAATVSDEVPDAGFDAEGAHYLSSTMTAIPEVPSNWPQCPPPSRLWTEKSLQAEGQSDPMSSTQSSRKAQVEEDSARRSLWTAQSIAGRRSACQRQGFKVSDCVGKRAL